jgi:hypothetical protein
MQYLYGAAEDTEGDFALFTITGVSTDIQSMPMRGLLFCSTDNESENPRELIDAIRSNAYDVGRPYQWLADVKKKISASVKIEFIQNNQHVRVRMETSGEKIINPLGTIDQSTMAVVLGGHNPFKQLRIPLDYEQWLKRQSYSMASSSVMRTPLIPCFRKKLDIQYYSESNHLAAQTYAVDRAQLEVYTRPKNSIDAIYCVLNSRLHSATSILELLKKSMTLNPAYIGMRVKLQLKAATAPLMFDFYRKSGRIRAAWQCKPRGTMRKITVGDEAL